MNVSMINHYQNVSGPALGIPVATKIRLNISIYYIYVFDMNLIYIHVWCLVISLNVGGIGNACLYHIQEGFDDNTNSSSRKDTANINGSSNNNICSNNNSSGDGDYLTKNEVHQLSTVTSTLDDNKIEKEKNDNDNDNDK